MGVSRKWLIDFEKGKSRLELGLVLRALAVLGIEIAATEAPRPVTVAQDLDAILTRARQPLRAPKRVPKPKRATKR
jgi:HTH-type transcriptional regulator / antitoxin HipB